MLRVKAMPVATGKIRVLLIFEIPRAFSQFLTSLWVVNWSKLLPAAFGWIATISPDLPMPCRRLKYLFFIIELSTLASLSPTPTFVRKLFVSIKANWFRKKFISKSEEGFFGTSPFCTKQLNFDINWLWALFDIFNRF